MSILNKYESDKVFKPWGKVHKTKRRKHPREVYVGSGKWILTYSEKDNTPSSGMPPPKTSIYEKINKRWSKFTGM